MIAGNDATVNKGPDAPAGILKCRCSAKDGAATAVVDGADTSVHVGDANSTYSITIDGAAIVDAVKSADNRAAITDGADAARVVNGRGDGSTAHKLAVVDAPYATADEARVVEGRKCTTIGDSGMANDRAAVAKKADVAENSAVIGGIIDAVVDSANKSGVVESSNSSGIRDGGMAINRATIDNKTNAADDCAVSCGIFNAIVCCTA